MNPIRRLILRVRATLWTAFSLVCIGAALLVGVANLLLPYADRYRPQVAAWLGERIGRTVSIEELRAEWAAFGPRVQLRGLAIGDGADRLQVDLASVSFDVVGWLRPGGHGTRSLRVSVEEVEIVRREDGSWGLGSEGQQGGQVRTAGNPLRWLRGQTATGLAAERVLIRDARSGLAANLPGGLVNIVSTSEGLKLSGRLGTRATGLIELAMDYDPEAAGSMLYAAGSSIDLSRWAGGVSENLEVAAGELDFELWADLESLTLGGDFTTTGLRLEGTDPNAVQGSFQIDEIGGKLSGWAQADDAGLLVSDLGFRRGATRWTAETVGLARQQGRLRLQATALPLQDLAGAAALFPALPPEWRRRLAVAAAGGTLEALDVAIARGDGDAPTIDGHIDLRGARWEPVDGVPGLSDLDVNLRFSDRQAEGNLSLDGAQVAFPGIFRNPFDPVHLDSRITFDWSGPVPVVEFDAPELRNAGVTAAARGRFELNGGRPLVELSAVVSEGQVAIAHRYWPINRMPPPAIAWLDRALVGGAVESGQVLLSGDLDDWPFRNGEGRFTARARVREGHLDFLPQWPSLLGLDADLEFGPFGMSGRVLSADLAGMRIGETDFDLPRFREPILSLQAQGRTSGAAALGFLAGIPLDLPFREYVRGLSIDGESDVWTNLRIPLSKRLGTTTLTGHAWLEGARIADEKWDIVFEDARGRVDFSETGIEAGEVAIAYGDVQATLSLRTGAYVQDSGIAAVGELASESSLAVLLEELDVFAPLLPRLTGSAPWEARVVVPQGGGPRFELACALDGSDVNLPAPIARDGPLPIRLSFNLGAPLVELDARLGDVGRLLALRDDGDSPWRAALTFGSSMATEPDDPGLTVTGTIPDFDVDAWLDLFEELETPANLAADQPAQATLNRIDLSIGHLRMAGRDFEAMRVRADRDRNWWNVGLEGDAVLGRFRLPSTLTENRLILAEFERLYWPRSEETEGSIETDFDPRVLPPMDFFAADLRLGDAPLGTVRFESHPTEAGMRIDSLSTEAPHLRVVANGDWFTTGESAFVATVTSRDLGDTLQQFGFSGMIEGGSLLAQLDAGWDGSPADFELARLNGSLELSIGKGAISEVEPGAGRIFGLLSVQALPRRLLLDFSDLFDDGLSFDSITGDFSLENGVAQTGDLIVEGPTADVLIQGRTGLAERDYDQVITVIPKVGGALPLVGAIAGGGVGAAAFLVLQGVLGDQIDQITRYHYAVTGPWADPAVELLGADDARLDYPRPEAGS